MKKFKSYFILILAATLMSGCSGLNKMKKNADLIQYEVTPEVLESHAGLVDVTIKGNFPEKYFDKKTTLTATPVLTYAGGESAFEKVQVLQGEKVMANNQVITYTGGNFTYTGSVPYNEDMKVSELMLRISAERGAKSLDFEPVKLADGVIATSTLVHKHVRPVSMADAFERITPESQKADINYVINRSDIRSSELRAEDIAKLREYIESVETDPDRVFKVTTISSYASPDGKFDFNEKLSGNRGSSADQFIKREFRNVESVSIEDFFDSKTTAEDWEGFKEEVENSNIPDKDLILRVLSMYSDPEVREREIRNMSSAFEALKTDILPKLRRSTMIVNVDKIGRTDEQIISQAKSDPSVLSLEEMLYAATLTEDLNDQLSFFRAAFAANPSDVRAANNIGVVLMAQGKTDEAITALERARSVENNDFVKSNLAFCSLVSGELEKAEDMFNSMSAQTTDSKCGLGMIAITKGEYDAAANYFGTVPCFNTALAQYLKGDINRAKATLDGFTPKCTTGKPGYLKAVVGARLDDKNYMLAGLREAIGFDSSWKDYAKTDIVLSKFWEDDAFKALVQ